MKFQLTEDQNMIRDSVREFAQMRILPNRMIWDEDQIFPRELFSEMGEIGLMGMLVPEHYGGAGLGYRNGPAALWSSGALGYKWY